MFRNQPRSSFPKCVPAVILVMAMACLLCACGGGSSGGTSVAQPPPTTPQAQSNPVPTISSVTPSTVTAGAGSATLTVSGSGFMASSTVQWNQSSRPATFVSPTELQLGLTAADLAVGGTAQLVVVNPAPGGGPSSAATITIAYPVPIITALSPATVTAGSAAFTLTITGTGFNPTSVVQYNGVARATTYVSATTLTISVSAGDVTSVGTAAISVVNGGPGGGTSAPMTLTIAKYATPTISSITPTSIPVNSPDTVVTIQGSGFSATSTVQVNAITLNASGWTPNMLVVTVPAAELTALGTLSVTVRNPGPLTSNAVTIQVVPNPVPAVTGLNPTGAALASGDFTLTVSGSNFVPTSVVEWNGSPRLTTFGNSTQLTATITNHDIASLGNSSVTVSNPAPGGGVSGSTVFTTYLSLPTNDLVYDAPRKLLWASVASSAGPGLGNSVVSIDPRTGAFGTPIWVGSEPKYLAISDDASTLWVAFMGSPGARKVDLVHQVATPTELYFPGGWGQNAYATSMAVLPGSPSSVAVASGSPANGGVAIYDSSAERAKVANSGATYLTFGASASTLYGWTYTGPLSVFTVDATGIAASVNLPSPSTSSTDLQYDNGRLYLTSGAVLDPGSGNLLGTFAASGPVAPDSSLGRAFVLNASPMFFNPNQITAFDLNTFVPLASFGVGGVLSNFPAPTSLVRWGEDGLAFRTPTQVYILRSPVVKDLSGTPANLKVSATAGATSAAGVNTTIGITVKNNGPSGASNVTVTDTYTSGAIFVSVSPSQGSCSGTAAIQCNLGTLANGASTTISLTVVPTAAGSLTNSATVSATEPDPDTSDNTANSTITITGSGYSAVPEAGSLSPQTALQGSPTFTLTVNGANFSGASVVKWNGAELPTTFMNSKQLTATVDASLISSAGSAVITVSNGAPGGGVSGALSFTIFQTVALDSNDIVFDPFTRKLYASVPSTATQVTGNSIVSIDPVSGAIGTPVFIGSEPTRMAISDDGQYLYVVLSGSNAVRRMALPTMTPGTQFTTTSTLFGAYNASDVAVMPGNPNTVATAGYADGIQVWDVTSTGATARPLNKGLSNNIYEGSVLTWGDAANLYSNDEGLSPSSFHRFTVDSTGFTETDSTYLDAVDERISYSGGLIFTDGGGVVDVSPAPPTTPKLVGRLAGGGATAADASIDRVFFLNPNFGSMNSRTITACDAKLFVQTGTTELDALTGDAFDLIRWGNSGLAFRTATDFWGHGSGRIVLMQGPAVVPRSANANPAPTISGLTPNSVTAPGANTWVTINGANFVPGAVAHWNGAERTTVFVNSGQLRVAIPAADLVSHGTATIQVVNPAPGGGSPAVAGFQVN
jgi:uncharacterized repeat protein (TIGR01451 family)